MYLTLDFENFLYWFNDAIGKKNISKEFIRDRKINKKKEMFFTKLEEGIAWDRRRCMAMHLSNV